MNMRWRASVVARPCWSELTCVGGPVWASTGGGGATIFFTYSRRPRRVAGSGTLVSRVPTFAVVGRMGLPLAAAAVGLALWSSGSWAVAAPTAAQTPSSADSLSVPAAGSEVAVSIPSVVLGQADGLPKTLTSRTYQAVLHVWLAAGSPSTVATVSASAGAIRGCHAVALSPATVNTLRCEVATPDARSLTLTVRVSLAGQAFQTSYGHEVRLRPRSIGPAA